MPEIDDWYHVDQDGTLWVTGLIQYQRPVPGFVDGEGHSIWTRCAGFLSAFSRCQTESSS
ncbi:Uncharacterised protein [Nocardia brasiliensis]|nr:Uncharacterised protein [Nocardia brasiliensis]